MTEPTPLLPYRVAVIGGGPAGLMAAEVLSQAGVQVDVYDGMPSVGRKFLLAGVGGMNITHSEPYPAFLSRYAERAPQMAPLLRAWLKRLRESGVVIHTRHRWLGWQVDGALRIDSPEGEKQLKPDAVLLALGGGSWARLGSDGAWMPLLAERGVELAALQASNCGFDVEGWSELLRNKFAGAPLKNIALALEHSTPRLGECVITASGIEGSLIYAWSAPIREAINQQGTATILIDLLPGKAVDKIRAALAKPRGSRSMSKHLHSQLGLDGVKAALLRELCPASSFNDPELLAKAIKALPLKLLKARPLDEAISTAGGVRFEALDEQLMLKQLPGVFCAGEMLDWEAPTGGYLLTGCFASGRAAGVGVLSWLTACACADRC